LGAGRRYSKTNDESEDHKKAIHRVCSHLEAILCEGLSLPIT
jgi:hypothetical protein